MSHDETKNQTQQEKAQTHGTIHPIRQSLAQLPSWLQPFLTWLTAYALPDQQPLLGLKRWQHVALTFSSLLLSIPLAMIMVQNLINRL